MLFKKFIYFFLKKIVSQKLESEESLAKSSKKDKNGSKKPISKQTVKASSKTSIENEVFI